MKKHTLSILCCLLFTNLLYGANRDIPAIPVGLTPDTNASVWLPASHISGQVEVSNLSSTISGTTATLSWTPSLNAITQAVWINSGSSWSVLNGASSLSYTATSHSATSLAVGTHYFQIVTTDSNGRTWGGNIVSAVVAQASGGDNSGGGSGGGATTTTPSSSGQTSSSGTASSTGTQTSSSGTSSSSGNSSSGANSSNGATSSIGAENILEDNKDGDINIGIVDNTTGNTNIITIDKTDTGTKLDTLTEKMNNENPNSKTFEATLKDDKGEEKKIEIVVENKNATSTTTTTGAEIESKSSNENKDITTKVQLNNNGTTVITLNSKDNKSGESNNAAIASFDTSAKSTIKEDGSVEVVTQKTNTSTGTKQETSVVMQNNGTVVHMVKSTDSSGNTTETKATSEAKNSTVTILEDGTVQTKAKTVDATTGAEATIAVNGNIDGSATHIITSTNPATGEKTTTKAESQIPGTQTTITNSGNVETTATKTEGTSSTTIKVTGKTNGEALHEVGVKDTITGESKTSSATSKVKGAQTKIAQSGNVETSAKMSVKDKPQIEAKAIVDTLTNGTSVTRFEYFDKTLNKTIQAQPTTKEGSVFEPGNKAVIEEGSDGSLQLKVTTPVSKPIFFGIGR